MNDELNTKKARSTAYPSNDLESAIGFTKLMRDNLGNGPYSRDLAAKALGHTGGVNGASSAKIAACVHFGLLARNGNTYSQSEIADMILTPRDDQEREQGIRKAVTSPSLYHKVINEYEGSALPVMLDNILVRTYKLTEKVAKTAAADFKKSVEFAGILVNGVINSTQERDKPAQDESVDENEADTKEVAAAKGPKTPTGYLTVVLPNTDVRILFPPEYAYDLSIGTFGDAIKSLAKAIASDEVAKNAESDTPAKV